MNSQKHFRAQPDTLTIGQEKSEEPASKRARRPPPPPPPPRPPTRDRQKRIAATEQRKRDARIWDKFRPESMHGVEEGGDPSVQSNPLPAVVEEEEEEEL
jgi:hypothetical protein